MAQSADLWWNVAGSSPWSTLANWNTAADGSGSVPGAAPGASDTAIFATSLVSVSKTPYLTADTAVGGLVINNTGDTTIYGNSLTVRTLTIGSGGVTMNPGAGRLVFGNTSNRGQSVALGASQSWINNSSSQLRFNYSSANTNSLDLGAHTLTIGGSGESAMYAPVLGSGSILKSGTGTLKFLGTNTYSGTTIISGGTLQVGDGAVDTTGSLGTGDVTNNGSLLFRRADAITVANDISGSGSVAYYIGSVVTVTGNNTYTGDTVVSNASSVTVGSDSNLGSGSSTVTIGQNAELVVTNSFATSKAFVMNQGNPALSIDAGITLTLNGSVGGINPGANGAFPPVKKGAGTLVLNGVGTFADQSTFKVGAGELDLGNAAALNGASLRMDPGAALDNTSGSAMTVTGIKGVEIYSGFTFVGSDDLDLSVAGAGFIGGTGNRTVTVSGNNLTIAGISTTGTDYSGLDLQDGGLIKNGSGGLIIKGASDYTGGTAVSAGTLVAAADSALGSSNVTVSGGAALVLTNGVSNDYIADTASLVLDGSAVLDLAFSGIPDTVGSLSLDGGSTTVPDGTYTASALSGLGTGTYTGTGSLVVGEGGVTEIGNVEAELLPGGSSLSLSWTAEAGASYAVQTNSDLVDGAWGDFQTGITGSGAVLVTNDLIGAVGFYRIVAE